MRHRVRTLLLAVTFALVLSAGAAGTAGAEVTQSQVTSPSDPSFVLGRATRSDSNRLNFVGTSDGTEGDIVDIVCTYGAGTSPDSRLNLGGALVQDDGTFSGSFVLRSNRTLQTCVLRAIPDDQSVSDYTPFGGPRVGLSQTDDEDNPNIAGVNTHDFFAGVSQLGGYTEWRSVSSCGLAYGYPYGDDFGFSGDGTVADEPLFNCAGALYSAGSFSNQSDIRIDGHSAYTAYGAQNASGGTFPQQDYPTATHTVDSPDPTTGAVTIHETEGLSYCVDAGATVIETPSNNCAHLQPTGVELHRTITQAHDGQQATIADTFVDTDHTAHSVTAIYDQHIGRDRTYDTSHQIATLETHPEFAFGDGPQTGGYGGQSPITHLGNDPNLDKGVIRIWGDPQRPAGLTDPQGSILFDQRPDSVRFAYSNVAVPNLSSPPPPIFGPWASDLEMTYQDRPLPADGTLDFTHVYTMSASRFAADQLTLDAAGGTDTPHAAVTDPADGSTVTAADIGVNGTVWGKYSTVHANVNGDDVGLDGNGAWGTGVHLNPGRNTITVVASNDGTTDQSTIHSTVIYSPTDATGASSVAPTSATLNGNSSSEFVDGVQFLYRKVGGVGTWTTAAKQDQAGFGDFSFPLTGLDPQSVYQYKVRAYPTIDGVYVYSPTRSFTTPPAVPTGADLTVDPVTDITTTGATLGATLNTHGASTSGVVEWGTTDAYGRSAALYQSGPTSARDLYRNLPTQLAPGTVYHYRITVTNGGGTYSTPDQSFATPATLPTVAFGAVDPIGSSTATINTVVDLHGSTLSSTNVQWGTTASYGKSLPLLSGALTIGGRVYTRPLISLKPNTLYHYRVTVTSVAGPYDSGDRTFTTTP